MQLSIASYNIHRCIGNDGRFDPNRILQVLIALQADIIALQELENVWHGGLEILDNFANAMGYEAIAGPTMFRKTGDYGNALLVKAKISTIERQDLTIRGGEPRGALYADLEIGGLTLRTVSTHLGLRKAERRFQIDRILSNIRTIDPKQPVILIGDFNEWFPWSSNLQSLHHRLGKAPWPATFPACLPLLALDRIWVWPRHLLIGAEVYKSRIARDASDHLPLKATLSY